MTESNNDIETRLKLVSGTLETAAASLQTLVAQMRKALASAKGEKGDKGPKGDKGDPGPKGDKGDQESVVTKTITKMDAAADKLRKL